MPVKIVADLHSAIGALRREVGEEDVLLLLGDLVNVIDYRRMEGILVDVYGAEAVGEVVRLRAERRYEEARGLMAAQRAGREAEVAGRWRELMRREYRRVGEALPGQTYLIPGNIDPPWGIEEILRPGVDLVDGKVVELEGLRVGFAGGGLPTPVGVAGEVPEEEFDAKLEGLGDVDVVCSHVPPDIPELTYDTVAGRHERGSRRLVEYVRDAQPRRVFFGHIHQPLLSSMHLGRTHLVNAGHFRRTGRAMPLSMP